MKIRSLIVASAALAMTAAPAAAQFSSDIPGIPRASVPIRGNHQNRTTWDLNLFTLGGRTQDQKGVTAIANDTLGFAARLGFGQSYRLGSRMELGYDLTLANGLFVRPPTTTGSTGSTGTRSGMNSGGENYARGLFLYALRVGAKFRPIQVLSPEGYGYEAAFGASVQPSFKPVFGFAMERDSTSTGGLLGKKDEQPANRSDTPGIFDGMNQGYQLAGMFSYRARRFLVDAAVLYEGVIASDSTNTAVHQQFTGISPRIGGMFRLTPGFAAGLSWWGEGASPWHDHVRERMPEEKHSTFAPMLSFGSTPEQGVDLIVAAPTGNFRESARLYIRARSTR